MKIKSMSLLIIFITVVALLVSGTQTALSQDIPEPTPAPQSESDIRYVFLPVMLKTNRVVLPPPPPLSSPKTINHNSVALFDRIPERYLLAASNIHMVFSDRSVGQNINEGLDCLAAASWSASPATCRNDYYDSNWNWRTHTQDDYLNGTVPENIRFEPSPTRYNRNNWTYVFRQGTWTELTSDFINALAPQYINSKNILTYQFSYLNVDAGSDIANQTTGFFANNSNKADIYDLEAYFDRHPDKILFLWTTSLARSIGTQSSTDFNNKMREYAINNGYYLFDVAAIESYTSDGSPCYDNRDGVPYCSASGNCENYPDDGKFLPAICQDYTTELNGGHLGSVSGGKIRLAKAFWVLMAQIAGWDGVSQ